MSFSHDSAVFPSQDNTASQVYGVTSFIRLPALYKQEITSVIKTHVKPY